MRVPSLIIHEQLRRIGPVGLGAAAVAVLAVGVAMLGVAPNGRPCASCVPAKRMPACRSNGSSAAS